MPEPLTPDAERRVQYALRSAIEVNLAREKTINSLGDRLAGLAFHSNGIIFSRSGNGTPHSNGIFFSRTGIATIQAGDPEDGVESLQGISELNEAAFTAFTERLLRLKDAKGEKPTSGRG
jgi:hypothetical protein